MSVLTANEVTQMNNMCEVAAVVALGTRLKYLDSDGSFNGPVTTGMDNKFDGTTTGAYLLWDTSEDELALVKSTMSFSGALDGSEHVIHITNTGLGDMKAFYAGAWGTELEFNDGGGLFRMYGKVGSGGTASVLMFIRSLTESTSPSIAAQFYADSSASSPGPTEVSAADFFGMINAGGYIASNTFPMRATWHKVGADVTSVINGNVATIWVDNQIHCAVAGWETSIYGSTGGSVPDSFIRLNTTSSGWANLLSFDSTMVGVAPLSASQVEDDVESEGTILMNINGTTYYIPYYAAADLVGV